jgi:zinc protease
LSVKRFIIQGGSMKKAFLALILIFLMSVTVFAGRTAQMTLDNGMVVVLKENHSTPLVSSVVCVRAGSKFEDETNNGFTHFLEHLLFNGTKSMDRIQLNEGFKDHGGYINAFTQKDLTAYLFVIPSEFTEYALQTQSDQLFNSILPDEEFPKERKIVIEEIKKDSDNPDFQAENFFDSLIYEGTPYARSVLGPKDVIANIPREQILTYYQERYVPNNMIALFIGDFQIESFAKLVNKYYGSVAAGKLPPPQKLEINPAYEKQIHYKEFPTKVTYIHMVFPAPGFKDPDYYAIDMLAQILDAGESSPLYKALVKGKAPLVNEMSVYVEAQSDFSLMHFTATTDNPQNVEQIVTIARRIFGDAHLMKLDEKQLNRIVIKNETDEIFLGEKLHYYGMREAPRLVNCGYDFIEKYVQNLKQVKPAAINKAATKYLSSGKYLAMAMVPPAKEGN